VLLFGCVMLALVVAKTLQLSTLLVPLLAGLWLRNRNDRPWLWPRHFGTVGGVLVLVLFVAVASSWSPRVMAAAGGVALAVLVVRFLAKGVAVFAFARPSGLAWRQAGCMVFALLPLSATAWVLALEFNQIHPGPGAEMVPLVLAAIGLTELLGPLAVLYALRWAREVDHEGGVPR
jgi:Kef-type K+ transport system membrane component KefB